MQIKTKGLKKKPHNFRAYHYWLVEEEPKRSRRLPQLNKANHIRKMHTPKSELLVDSIKAESEPPPVPKKKGKK